MKIPVIPVVSEFSGNSLPETVCRPSSMANHSVFDSKSAALDGRQGASLH